MNTSTLRLSTLSTAITIACISLSSAPLLALPAPAVCDSSNNTISSVEPNSCILNGTQSLTVTSDGVLGSSDAYAVRVLSTVTGNIINSGTIHGTSRGIEIQSGDSLDGNITNNINATISSDGFGGIYNRGTITGNILNSGLISTSIGTGIFGIGLYRGDLGGDIINNATGTIQGTDRGISLDSTSTISGDILNNGIITATDRGIFIINSSTLAGTLTNNNTISATAADSSGILLSNGSINSGIVNNSGATISGNTAISLESTSTITGGITNRGSISGTDYSVFTSSVASLSDIFIEGSTAQLTGDVLAQNTALTIKAGADFSSSNAFDVKSVTVENGATFNISQLTKTALMSDGIKVSAGFSNDGITTINAGQTATINGDYTQTANGLLRIGVSSNSNYGQLSVSGTATLASNAKFDVDVNASNTLANNDVLSSVLSAGTLNSDGSFTVTDNSALFDFTARINGNAIDLTTTKTLAIANAVSSPSVGAARVFDDLVSSGSGNAAMNEVITTLGRLATTQQVADAVESTLPSLSGGIALAANVSSRAVSNVVASRQGSARGLSSGDTMLSDRHLWFKPFGNDVEQDTRQGVSGYDIDSLGFAFGIDGDISSNWMLGFAVAYINSDVNSKQAVGSQSVDIDSYQAKIYASTMLDDITSLSLQAGVGHSNYDSKRRIFTGAVAKADYDSWNIQLSAELARSYQLNTDTMITPYIHADYSYVDVDSYNESGAAALNLNVNDSNADSLLLGGGINLNHALTSNLTLLANVGLAYDVLTERSSLTSSFAGGGAKFSTEGIKPDQLVYNTGVGVQYSLVNGTEISANYDVTGREDYTDQSVTAKLRWLF